MRRFQSTRTLLLSRPAVIATLAAAFALILTTGLLTAFSTRDVALADQRAAQAQRTLGLAMQFLTTLSDAAVSARSTILTGQDRPRAAYDAARARYGAELDALRREFGTHDGLADVFAELQQLADERFAAFDRALDALRTRGSLPALSIIDAAENAHPTDEFRRLVAALPRREFNELAAQSALASRRAVTIHRLNVGVLLIAGAAAVGLARWLAHRFRDFDRMVTVCAWTRRVLWEGEWITFEEYLIKRFDVRCTHGICDEAAAKMKAEATRLQVPEELRRTRRKDEDVDLAGGHSAAPFA
jgi:CHASE3 domain sensor protein